MSRVFSIANFLEAIRETPAPAAALRFAETASPASLRVSVSTALRILDTLKGHPNGMESSLLMKATSADFVEFLLALQSLEKLSAVVVDRQSDARIAHLGPAWQDARPLLIASL